MNAFEQPIEYARMLLEEESFLLPEIPVGPTPTQETAEESPEVLPEQSESSPPLDTETQDSPSLPEDSPTQNVLPELPVSTQATQPEPTQLDIQLPSNEPDSELPVFPPVEPHTVPLPVTAPEWPLEAFLPVIGSSVVPEMERPVAGPLETRVPQKDVSFLGSVSEGSLPISFPEVINEQPREIPGDVRMNESMDDKWLNLPLQPVGNPVNFEGSFPAYPSMEDTAAMMEREMEQELRGRGFETPDNSQEMIRDAINRESLFINMGSDG